jgi:hypothetical protein
MAMMRSKRVLTAAGWKRHSERLKTLSSQSMPSLATASGIESGMPPRMK